LELFHIHRRPAVTNEVVFVDALNGTLEARDRNSGESLWEFQTETSKQNANWVLTADRRFNFPLLFFDGCAKDRSYRPIGNLPSARSFRHRSWQTASSISEALTVSSTRWSEEVRARHGESSTGRALLAPMHR